jgi:G protein-coupled receptor GPR1
MRVLELIFLIVGAAVDCWLFSTREKPWRHIPDTKGGFWESLKFWTGWKGVSKRRVVKGPGRTREEMVKEARSAYRRRDEELAQRKVEAAASGANGEANVRKVERSWWDTTGFDGSNDMNKSMSPVVEESNLMENEKSDNERSVADSEATLRNSDTTRSREVGDEITPIGEEDTSSINEKDDFISISTTKKHGK